MSISTRISGGEVKPREWTMEVGLGLRERPGGPPGNYHLWMVSGELLNLGDAVRVIEKSAYDRLELMLNNVRLYLGKEQWELLFGDTSAKDVK